MTDKSLPPQGTRQDTQSREPCPVNEVDLQYPQLLLQASFASLLSSSFPSTSESQVTVMPASEHSLSESWASLSEADYTAEEDTSSIATDTVSLFGANASEDLHDTQGPGNGQDPNIIEQKAAANIDQSADLSTPLQTSVAKLCNAQPYDSTSTLGEPSPNAIKFTDLGPKTGRVELMHSVKVFDEEEKEYLASFIPNVRRAVQLNGTIRMTTSSEGIRSDRPFRLLYGGSPHATETRAEILKKVGDVLVASTEQNTKYSLDASRYHVIPSEFGPGSSPNYAELIPLQFQQMIVDECVAAEASEHALVHSQIKITYKSGQSMHSIWDGSSYRNLVHAEEAYKENGWDIPDLAIIFVGEDDDRATQLFSVRLNEFTSRHHVPTLIIRGDNSWSTCYGYIVPNRQSLHMCIESRSTGVLERLPVDLSTFINLDAAQLNKHIACLCSISEQNARTQKIALKLKQSRTGRANLADVEKNLSKSIVGRTRASEFLTRHESTINKMWQASLAVLLLVVGVSFCRGVFILLAGYFGGVTSMTDMAQLTTTPSFQTAMSVVTATDSVPTATVSVSASSLQTSQSVVGLTAANINKELARLASDAAAVHNNSDKFQVQILGDGHVVVKVPQKMLAKKKTPKLFIKVMRGAVEVPSNSSRLFDGLYTVKIDREHAHGLLNITIVVKKPAISETHELEFGTARGTLRDRMWQSWLGRLLAEHRAEPFPLGDLFAPTLKNLQSMSTFTVALMNNATSKYGPSVRKAAQAAQNKSQDMYAVAVRQAQASAEVLARETRAELQELGAMSKVAAQQATVLSHNMIAKLQSSIAYLRDRAAQVDLEDIRDKVVRSNTLAEAQERARKVASDVSAKLKSHREKKKAQKAERRKGRVEKKLKQRAGKQPWHDNVRVNLGPLHLRL